MSAAMKLAFGKQITLFLQPMQQWVHSAWTNRISMSSEFFDHALTVDGLFIGMMQNMHADQTSVEVAIIQQVRHAPS